MERCTGNCGDSLKSAYVFVSFVSAVNSFKFYLTFCSCLRKRPGKDSLVVSFPQSCLDSLLPMCYPNTSTLSAQWNTEAI